MLGTNPTLQKFSTSASRQVPQEMNLGSKPHINTTRYSLVSGFQARGSSPADRETIKFQSNGSTPYQNLTSDERLFEETLIELKRKAAERDPHTGCLPNWRFSDRVQAYLEATLSSVTLSGLQKWQREEGLRGPDKSENSPSLGRDSPESGFR